MIKRVAAIEIPQAVWTTVFTAAADAKLSLFVVNHLPNESAVSIAFISDSQHVEDKDIFIANAPIEAKSYRVFKDILMENLLTLVVASEQEGLTLTVVGELFT